MTTDKQLPKAPRWIAEAIEAIDSSYHGPGVGLNIDHDIVARELLARLPRAALTAAVREALAGDSGAMANDPVTMEYAGRVIAAVLSVLAGDGEASTMAPPSTAALRPRRTMPGVPPLDESRVVAGCTRQELCSPYMPQRWAHDRLCPVSRPWGIR